MKLLQEKLDFLLDKYSVFKDVTLISKEKFKIGEKEIPNLSHRSDRRFIELKNIVENGTLVGISVMRVSSIWEKGSNLDSILFRELDICRWILGDDYKSVMAIKNGEVMNVIALMCKGTVCTFELSATLKKGTPKIDKHEIISRRGIACDTVVDAQLKQDSIYLFTDKNQVFTDVDFELYGLAKEDIFTVRFAFETAKKGTEDKVLSDADYIRSIADKVNCSVISGEKEVISK